MGFAYGQALLLISRPFGQALVLLYSFVDLRILRDSADIKIQHTLSRMVWQPPFELTMSAEASRVVTRCHPRLKRSEGGKGHKDI